MLIPAPRLLVVAGVLLALAVIAAFQPSIATAWMVASLCAIFVAGYDAVRLARERLPDATRTLPGTLALGTWQDVVLNLHNRSERTIALDVTDHFPSGMAVDGLPLSVQLPAGETGRMRYRIRPIVRGDQSFAQVEVRKTSRLGLWMMRQRVGNAETVRVYPNFSAISRYAALAQDQRLMQIGVVQQRRRGEGQDFRQLRDYRTGDSLRSVDWKATARTGRLISREFQEERNQQVVLMLDCGRRMLAHDGAIAHFDHALNAALLLASVSLKHGDAVGLLTMGTGSAESVRFVAPRRAPTTINTLLESVYDLQPSYSATDYLRSAMDLVARVRKRALVVVMTNLHEEETSELLAALQILRTRHLVVLASLREESLREALLQPTPQLADALTQAAAADYLLQRNQAFRRIERQGTACVDVEPAELGVALVNRYLQIKRAGRL
jgi:uncharacterized protein (DUF58 family)